MRRPGPPTGGASNSRSAPSTVAAEGRRGRKRGGSRGRASTVRRIDETSRERQDAWAEGGQPNRTYTLTRELDGLYDQHRGEQAGTLTDPYYGRTMRAGR